MAKLSKPAKDVIQRHLAKYTGSDKRGFIRWLIRIVQLIEA